VDSFEKPVCRQKYAQLGLLAINQQGELDVHPFTVPTTCVCHVRPIIRKRRTTAMSKAPKKGKGKGKDKDKGKGKDKDKDKGKRKPKKNSVNDILPV
jgi:hypothetical protein